MASDPGVLDAQGVRKITLKTGVSVIPGTLLGYNAGWVKADADGRFPAVLMAMEYGDGDISQYASVHACRAGVLFDVDAPFTAGADQYLSATAGAFTATMPAISATLTILQKIGVALSTSEMLFDLNPRGPVVLRASAAVNPASGATDTVQNLAVTVTGVLATDYALLGSAPAVAQGVIYNGSLVCTADTVTVGIANASAGTVDGASTTVEFLILRN